MTVRDERTATGRRSIRAVTVVLLNLGMGLVLASCEQPLVTIQIPGDFSAFSRGILMLHRDDAEVMNLEAEIVLTAEGATAELNDVLIGRWDVAVRLEQPREADEEREVIETFTATATIPVKFGVEVIELNGIHADGPLRWKQRVEVRVGDAVGVFPADPCERFSALILPSDVSRCAVDADRSLYDGPIGQGGLLAFIFDQAGESCEYQDGENIFSDEPIGGPGRFSEICASNAWGSADALTCYESSETTLACIFFSWESPNDESSRAAPF